MATKPSTRAARMAAQYGEKLKQAGVLTDSPRQIRQSDRETQEQRDNRRKALAKLRTFLE